MTISTSATRTPSSGPNPLTAHRWSLRECQRSGNRLQAVIGQVLEDFNSEFVLERRALAVRTLLILPRIADERGLFTVEQVREEVARAAEQLRSDMARIALPPLRRPDLSELRFEEIDPKPADAIFNCLHYLRHAREGSRNFALVHPDDGSPIALCSVSPLEWKRLGRLLRDHYEVEPVRVRDLSRVYAFDIAPNGAISSLLRQVRRQLRIEQVTTGPRKERDDAAVLTTTVDPNLGFTGQSYRGSNWQHWITVMPRPYLYYNNEYRTPRSLREETNTASLEELKKDPAFVKSQVRLQNSLVFCRRVYGPTEPVSGQPLLRR